MNTKLLITAISLVAQAHALDLTANQWFSFAEVEYGDTTGGPGANLHCICPPRGSGTPIPACGLGQAENSETCECEFTDASCAARGVIQPWPVCSGLKFRNIDTCQCVCPTSQCPAAETQNSSNCQCEPRCTAPKRWDSGSSSCVCANTCPSDTTRDDSTCACNPRCSGPKRWDSGSSSCVCANTCPSDTTRDDSTCACNPRCSGPKRWDSGTSSCVCQNSCPTGFNLNPDCSCTAKCTLPKVWNGSVCACTGSAPNVNPNNWQQNADTCNWECKVTPPSCPSGQSWSASSCSCQPTCPAPKVWNGSQCVCGDAGTRSSNPNWSQNADNCSWTCNKPADPGATVGVFAWNAAGCAWQDNCPEGQYANLGACVCRQVGKPGVDWDQETPAKGCKWYCRSTPVTANPGNAETHAWKTDKCAWEPFCSHPGKKWNTDTNECECRDKNPNRPDWVQDNGTCNWRCLDAAETRRPFDTPNPGNANGRPQDHKWKSDVCRWECERDCEAEYPESGGWPWSKGWEKDVDRATGKCGCKCKATAPPGKTGCTPASDFVWKAEKCGCACDVTSVPKDGFNPNKLTRQCRGAVNTAGCNCGCETAPTGYKCPPGWTEWNKETCSCCPWGLYKKCLDAGQGTDFGKCQCTTGTQAGGWIG